MAYIKSEPDLNAETLKALHSQARGCRTFDAALAVMPKRFHLDMLLNEEAVLRVLQCNSSESKSPLTLNRL